MKLLEWFRPKKAKVPTLVLSAHSIEVLHERAIERARASGSAEDCGRANRLNGAKLTLLAALAEQCPWEH
jgi:hypothetical protein